MNSNDTIVAISTPIGVSAIGIVRLSGKNSINIAKKITKMSSFLPRYAHLKYLYDNDNNIIDRGIVIYFKAPNSFNGEDIIEFQCHGGILVCKKILDTCINFGARLARAGEFSKIALINGKMDLSMIETISKLISTQSTEALKLIAKNLSGDLKNIIDNFREDLIEILAHTEALIDYAEEDLPKNLNNKIDNIVEKLTYLHKHSLSMQNTIDGHKLAIIGKPNVGKSSILNKLLLKDRAIVSEVEGTTRDIIQENITINNQVIKIIDTAGIRESIEIIEKIGIQKTIDTIKESTIILAVFDNSKEFNDSEILEILYQNKDKIIIIAINKSDKENRLDKSILKDFECIEISTLDNSVYKIRDLIGEKIAIKPLNDDFVLLNSKRQLDCVESCIKAIHNAKNNLYDYEIFSFYINDALYTLELLSKPFSYDEMLDKMFSSFCLGK
ncbi:tRNA uridine-5-carboxymethylaminomethyl(34) synthesis GTPase MnmE [Helicobacter sp. MIT 14-3879]|uniref:tRNA uridine-5-carboxymethylaminomethyl(34) synthesis GTPase MnmE n=1 Tax=Helicobacter sp. MIT 14-3879 TaxID=2040649 RepID=UPI000E1EE6BC|nr:tRNA uridine-5-carboxymethylaminomethyl(34) synthesis GTPase MnmE [Helicobacter sp. MIT 14-3879]RDU64836.1 tRNA uridine-5-carboxymethylaminomethyl(34) synthesis GTPase MnmE [Helicobacter sp. MIT 14-3879]